MGGMNINLSELFILTISFGSIGLSLLTLFSFLGDFGSDPVAQRAYSWFCVLRFAPNIAQGIICGDKDWTRVNQMQGKCINPCTISLVLVKIRLIYLLSLLEEFIAMYMASNIFLLRSLALNKYTNKILMIKQSQVEKYLTIMLCNSVYFLIECSEKAKSTLYKCCGLLYYLLFF